MKMNRRNVLVGLGTIVAGGGAALGTGAFSSVEADRTVTVSTASDTGGDALVGFTNLDGNYVTENSDGVIEIDVSNVNVDSTTTIKSAFEIVNNHDSAVTLDAPYSDSESNITVTLSVESTSLSQGGTTAVDVEVDTTDASSDDSFDKTITITVSPQ